MSLPIDDSLTLNDADFDALTDITAVSVEDARDDAESFAQLAALLFALLALTPSGDRVDVQTGDIIVERRILSAYDRRNAAAIDELRQLAQGVIDGRGSLDDLTAAGLRELRNAHTQSYALGRGGINALTRDDYAIIQQRLRAEGGYWRDFMRALGDGNISEAEMRRRFDLYARGTRSSYFDGLNLNASDVGFTEERRVLNPAEHCADCTGYAAQGWQPIGTLPAPGDGSVCLHNCKCNKLYR